MKIKQTVFSEKGWKKWNYRSFLQIEVDGKKVFRFLDGEPEDAILGRDFNDAYKIIDTMEKAYHEGRGGGEFEVEKVEIDDMEY